MGTQSVFEINTPRAKMFQQVVTEGWANLSDGNVEAPTGHFAVIQIDDNELGEVRDAFDSSLIEAGSYLLIEDSDGNAALHTYPSLDDVMKIFNELQARYGGE